MKCHGRRRVPRKDSISQGVGSESWVLNVSEEVGQTPL